MSGQDRNDLIEEFVRQRPVALVGASADPGKYGNIILKNLRGRGWAVLAVNPKGGQIEGEPAYESLAALPEAPGLVVVVTPPSATLTVLEEAAELGYGRIWLQQGAESPAVLARADELGLRVVHDACIMVLAARLGNRG